MGRISVLLVDNSKTSRQLLKSILNSDAQFHTIAEANDAQEALDLAKKHRPNIVLIDANLPNKEAVLATRKIMAFCPAPIIMLTNPQMKQSMNSAFEALTCGASEVSEKPQSLEGDNTKFINIIKLVSNIKVITHLAGKREEKKENANKSNANQRALLIASSTGGPNALKQILINLDTELNAGVIIAQHIAKGFMPGLISWLSQECKLKIKEAQNGDELQKGVVLFCPAGSHTKIKADGTIKLIDEPSDNIMPCADILFESAAQFYNSKAVGVILTGMGADGAEGLLKIKEHGGMTIAQDEKSCVIFGMPKKAISLGAAQKVLPIEHIADYINKFFGGSK